MVGADVLSLAFRAFSKRATICLGSDQLCWRTGADGLLCQSLQCQSAQPLRVALALFRELNNQLGDLVRCWIAAIN
jgi:hypothetical protein